MVTKIYQITGIYRFEVNKKYLTYTTNTFDQFTICSLEGVILHKYNTSPRELNFPLAIYNDGFSWTNKKGPVAVVYHEGVYQELDFPLTAHLEDDSSSYGRKKDKESGLYTKINTKGETIWESKDLGFSITFPTIEICFFRKGFNQLTALNNQTGKEIWTYTLPDSFDYIDFTSKNIKARIVKILGVHKNNTWLLINNGSLLAIDILTGKQTANVMSPNFTKDFNSERQQNITDHIAHKNYGVFNNSPNNVQLDANKGVIFGFPYQSYAEVDLNDSTYPFTIWDINNTLESQKEADKLGFDSLKIGSWETNNVYVYDLFFDSSRFGVFDRATKEISWSEYFGGEDEGWGAIQDLKYTSGYLYIHAKVDKSLHIYKLE